MAQSKPCLVLSADKAEGFLSDPSEMKDGRRLNSSDPFYIIYTSGSTGEPKGVVITLGNLNGFLDWMLTEHSFREGKEVFLNQAPFSFDLSVMDLYLTLATGGTLFSITREELSSPKRLYRALAASRVTVWVSTPSFAQMCLAERDFSSTLLPHLKRFIFCGETLPHDVAASLIERFPAAEVWNTYGPTEATVATTSVRIDRDVLDRHQTLPVGRPRPDTKILIFDESGQIAAPGQGGQIVIAGPNVSGGYFGRPDLTEKSFFQLDGERAYRTGDLGFLQDGMLFFNGRLDSQIKLHGYRIELGDVEENLCLLPEVRDAIVIPVMKGGNCDSLAAFIVLKEKQYRADPQTQFNIRKQLSDRLPTYMLPRKLFFFDQFPMTPNGKADRRKLTEYLA